MINEPVSVRWIKLGIVAGLCSSILYPLLIFSSLPLFMTALLAGILGPAIGVASLGLRELLLIRGNSVSARVGAVANFTAGALFTAMALVQLACRYAPASETASAMPVGVWLGLDVAWDIYIGLGTAFFSVAMLRHERFGALFAVPGVLIALLVIGLNIATFPTPPAEAGLIDIGPFVGLWYLAVTVRTWRSLPWAREHAQSHA
ncbi:MAG TPA: hypothetical protein VMY18_10205 [Acidobacteriota bacterium]|nr:hypothetical protein [Acidobacteriota bacterium]